MRTLKIILITIVSILILILLIGFLLPSKMTVSRERVMQAPPEQVYNVVNDLHLMGYWDAWSHMDPNMKVEFEGPATGVGSVRKWKGEKMGEGTMTITDSKPNEKVTSALDFGSNGKANADMTLSPEGTGTKVVWSMESDMGMNPIGRYMGVFMKGMLEKQYDEGLARLDSFIQATPQQAAPTTAAAFEPKVTDVAEQWIVSVRSKNVGMDQIASFIEGSYGKIGAYLGEKKVQPAGPPGLIMHKWDEKGSDVEAFMPVAAKVDAKGDITSQQLKYKKAVAVEYFGDYAKMEQTYTDLEKWMETNKVKAIGSPWEVYITDPMTEKDTAKWQTNIFYPVE
jgi:effector-binding domain-containing protein/carbon monoxide dehydrogenase subunit G